MTLSFASDLACVEQRAADLVSIFYRCTPTTQMSPPGHIA